MSTNSRFFRRLQFSLPLQISAPFILMFLGSWIVGGTLVGQHFSEKLEQDQQEQTLELASLVKREIDRELYSLRRSARLLAGDESIVRGTSQSSSTTIQQEILPLKSILETDFIAVFDRNRRPLIDTRSASLLRLELSYEPIIDMFISGADLSTIVSTNEKSAPLLTGTAPIKDEQGVVGGVILGTSLGNELLSQINQSIQEQIIVISDDRVVASTLPIEEGGFAWDSGGELSRKVTIESELFFAQPIQLEGFNGNRFEVVLLISQRPLLQAKQALWLFILGLTSAGSLMTAVIGYWMARNLARPIQSLTELTLKVVEENNFELQIPVERQDEIGVLSGSVNQLIQWVGEYTHKLEDSAKMLETRVTERTQDLSVALSELKETQTQLIQTEKMSGLGQMVAGIAHEINNPISFIQGNIKPLTAYFEDITDLLETYEREYPQPVDAITEKQEDIDLDFLLKDVNKILGSMKMGTGRVRDIIVSLRNFSRLDEATIKDVDLSEGLDSTLLILNHRIKQGVKVIKDYAPLPSVICSPAQLNQVFTNIIANALDAMFEADGPKKELVVTTRVLPDDQVQVSIKDSGPGMPEEVINKIFDPFFTTKPVGKGTGLGLGICFKIIQQHQGTLTVNSEVGSGTEFLITLPRHPNFESAAEADADATKQAEPSTAAESTVSLVAS